AEGVPAVRRQGRRQARHRRGRRPRPPLLRRVQEEGRGEERARTGGPGVRHQAVRQGLHGGGEEVIPAARSTRSAGRWLYSSQRTSYSSACCRRISTGHSKNASVATGKNSIGS